MATEVNQMKSSGRIWGELSELALEKEESFVVGDDGKKIPCQRIVGSMSVENENGIFVLEVYSTSKTKKNKENPMFPGMETIMETYVSKVDAVHAGDVEPDKVSCRVDIDWNVYAKDGKLNNNPYVRLKLNSARRVKEISSTPTGVEIEGVISEIVPEMKNEEETGRQIVTFINVGFDGLGKPYKLIVDSENIDDDGNEWSADDFLDNYEVGDTCVLYCDVKIATSNNKTNRKKGFGSQRIIEADSNVPQLFIVGGEPPYDEDSERAIDSKTLKELENEWKIHLDNLVEESKNKSSNKSKKKETKSTKGLGKKRQVDEDDDDDEDVDIDEYF